MTRILCGFSRQGSNLPSSALSALIRAIRGFVMPMFGRDVVYRMNSISW
jgi:hypothetical protein